MCFFDLHREGDPKKLLTFISAALKPNAPIAFIDFVSSRTNARLRTGFEEPLSGSVRGMDQIGAMLEQADFRLSETDDETRIFRSLVSRGFARWRDAYQVALMQSASRSRAEFALTLSRIAHCWAERNDAMQAGHLQVIRIIARRRS